MTANLRGAYAQVALALADWANEVKANGLSTWEESDFRVAAEKFVDHLDHAVLLRDLLKLNTQTDYKSDMLENLSWDIDLKYKAQAIDIGLFEIGTEFTGLDFDPE